MADDFPPCSQPLSLPSRKQGLSRDCMLGMSLALRTHQRARPASLLPRSPRPSAPNSSPPAEAKSLEGQGPLSGRLCSFPGSVSSRYHALHSLQLAGMSWRGLGLLFQPCLLPDPVLQTHSPRCACHLTGLGDADPSPRRPLSSGSVCPPLVHSHRTAFAVAPDPKLEVRVPHSTICHIVFCCLQS